MIIRFVIMILVVASIAVPAFAGVVNPDISVIGQPATRWSDDPSDPARKRLILETGSEILRSPALLGGQSFNSDLNQEVQCS